MRGHAAFDNVFIRACDLDEGLSQSFEMAESFFNRADRMLDQATNQRDNLHPAESISAAQESMEFYIKSVFLYLQEEYPRSHEIKDEEFMKVLQKLPGDWKEIDNFPRLLLIMIFWSNLYTITKYGNERLGIGPEKLLKRDEADLAVKHADECHLAAFHVRDWASQCAV